ncbi:RNA polymerase sigma factor [Polyangium mundeleinium]|uniref:Sigma-70 family RNA polymerase sigma factor n=1 Tax=Polyangium mundeleinium TaxID=2995306 RepID=A0ABT5EJK5_9BACT|nr:sigma-70 family RNA polymerase sigma factor [Polyangium mundeleinium]MDC0741654.1 sigma-70 family RNA polymerase sigma factor [Polyangium mundeleinium]
MSNVDVYPESAKKPATLPYPEATFARFYRESWDFVRRVLLKRGVPEREADDLVQEVFIVAWRRRDSVAFGEQARLWLSMVALYIASNHRKLARYRTEELAGELPEPAVFPRVIEVIDAAHLLARALRKLGRKVAAVLVAYEIEGRSMPEIARMLRIRLTTAYACLQLARNRLALHAPF